MTQVFVKLWQREGENTHWHLGKISSEDAGDVMRRILLLLPV